MKIELYKLTSHPRSTTYWIAVDGVFKWFRIPKSHMIEYRSWTKMENVEHTKTRYERIVKIEDLTEGDLLLELI